MTYLSEKYDFMQQENIAVEKVRPEPFRGAWRGRGTAVLFLDRTCPRGDVECSGRYGKPTKKHDFSGRLLHNHCGTGCSNTLLPRGHSGSSPSRIARQSDGPNNVRAT